MTRFDPAGALRGTFAPPPDKSISHRAAIVAAMAEGETEISGYLDAADARSTLAAVAAVGAAVDGQPPDLRVRGAGLRRAVPAPIDVGNAGTLLRLLPGWLAGQPGGEWRFDGDDSIRRRPVDRIVEPLRRMGAVVEAREERLVPLVVHGSALRGISYRMPVASAQVKSCLLLAGLLADGPTSVIEPRPTRDHTERMLRAAGADVRVEDAGTPVTIHGELPAKRVTVGPAERLEPSQITVPGDFSSAAFFLVAATIVAGSEVRLEGVGINPGRVGLLGILNRMGAATEVVETPAAGREPVATLVARPAPLRATRVSGGEVPLAIDELPLVALAGSFAEGRTIVSGAEELRHKESDRIATVVEGLRGLGAEIEATDDGFAVIGTGGLRGGALSSRGDHRLAMLGAIAGLASKQGVEVDGFEAAGVSYPGFERDLRALAA
ncbi:MAG TPA: 3-phosphoshikimate 1-carboxyvinyltransferase [Solirubrobacterales bacterium]|nr:3-phosphoshikimate 1-carboxyvinyltransferase [Solirubrobacterales bacterium]